MHGKRKGSMTIYFCLLLAVFLSLFAAALNAARNAGARVQAVHAADQGMYSLFSRYDRTLLERYHLFFIDGTFGSGSFQSGMLCEFLEQDIEKVLATGNGLSNGLELDSTAITGYTLATDYDGNAVKAQAIDYMESLLGVQGVKSLLSMMEEQTDTVNNQEVTSSSSADMDSALDAYESVKEQGEENARQEAAAAENTEEGAEETEEEETIVPDGYVNPVETVKSVLGEAVLALVLPSEKEVSGTAVVTTDLLSGRTLEEGIGEAAYESVDEITDELLFNEYILRHFGCFTEAEDAQGLQYQVEYVIAGEDSDQENLGEVAESLIAVRMASNVTYLLRDKTKRAEITAAAAILAAVLRCPDGERLLEAALLVCWAFAESVCDVRSLLNDKSVPLVKTDDTWKLSLEELAEFLSGESSSSSRDSDEGLDYKAYLRILLALKNHEEKLKNMMDMLEAGVRAEEGKESFRLDCCIYTLNAEFTFETDADAVYTAARSYGYDMQS